MTPGLHVPHRAEVGGQGDDDGGRQHRFRTPVAQQVRQRQALDRLAWRYPPGRAPEEPVTGGARRAGQRDRQTHRGAHEGDLDRREPAERSRPARAQEVDGPAPVRPADHAERDGGGDLAGEDRRVRRGPRGRRAAERGDGGDRAGQGQRDEAAEGKRAEAFDRREQVRGVRPDVPGDPGEAADPGGGRDDVHHQARGGEVMLAGVGRMARVQRWGQGEHRDDERDAGGSLRRGRRVLARARAFATDRGRQEGPGQ